MRCVFLLLFVVGCTKQNPNLCCTDEVDCTNVGLEEVKGCSDGLLCRGNQCIAEVCASSAECDADAPFCRLEPDGRCQQTCTEDNQCPGFGQAASDVFCEAGACVECRTADDCGSASTPICSAGTCVGCSSNDQCESGVCVDDGTCAVQADVAYVAPNGPSTGDCLESSPCATIESALSLGRPFIVIESGTYTRVGTLSLVGTNVRLIGRGATRPILRRSATGSIVTISSAASVSFESIEISGATGATPNDAHGIRCTQQQGVPKVRLVDVVLRNNALGGMFSQACTVDASRSEIRNNAGFGLQFVDTNATIDRCVVADNAFDGASLDVGVYAVTNSFVVRNGGNGVELTASAGCKVEFNTIVDNGSAVSDGTGFFCNASNLSFPNNIIARNKIETAGSGCTFPNSIIIDSDITPLKFVSPEAAPFDFHIQAGSLAIDAATITTIDHDFDGDVRPGNAADVGADEL